ncbi:unnamed protein product [Moneuplotes crassus]|uniref:Uncharacterized protein n=1 Tax=Euplotes crassus TaxID=5936 RepID=A0AAD1XYA4_EUPCR|nr:unnamed protein product [Moneuplotes crassus]
MVINLGIHPNSTESPDRCLVSRACKLSAPRRVTPKLKLFSSKNGAIILLLALLCTSILLNFGTAMRVRQTENHTNQVLVQGFPLENNSEITNQASVSNQGHVVTAQTVPAQSRMQQDPSEILLEEETPDNGNFRVHIEEGRSD